MLTTTCIKQASWCWCLLTWQVLSNRLRRKHRNSLHELWYSFRTRSDHPWDWLGYLHTLRKYSDKLALNDRVVSVKKNESLKYLLEEWSNCSNVYSSEFERTIRNSPLIVGWMNFGLFHKGKFRQDTWGSKHIPLFNA